MAVSWAHHVLNRHVAPGIEKFDAADIPDMSTYDAQCAHWVANYFLNSVLRGSHNLPVGAYAQNFMRRAQGAFSEHAVARDATMQYLASDATSPTLYAKALLHWEFYLGQSWQGYELLRRLIMAATGDDGVKIFVKGDGSVAERLWLAYNSMKHVEKRIASGQVLDGTVSAVWLSNEGIECTDGCLSWTQTGDVLADLARWANMLVDPIEMPAKLSALPDDRL
jgi:hypothetical protein